MFEALRTCLRHTPGSALGEAVAEILIDLTRRLRGELAVAVVVPYQPLPVAATLTAVLPQKRVAVLQDRWRYTHQG